MRGALAEYRSVTSDINASILASRLRALFAFITTPFSHVWRFARRDSNTAGRSDEFLDYLTTFPRQQIVPAPHNLHVGSLSNLLLYSVSAIPSEVSFERDTMMDTRGTI